MHKTVLVALAAGLLLGAGITYAATRGTDTAADTAAETSMAGMDHGMPGPMDTLTGKSGDELDKAFLAEMITHHQGAIDMAKRVQADGKHEELKAMADAIVSAQGDEIARMRQWQQDCGY